MSNSVRPHRQQPTRLPHPWDSPGKNTGVGCHCLLCFPIFLFSSISLHSSLKKAFLSLCAILQNSAFSWVYLPFLLCFSLLFFSQLFVRPPEATTLPSCHFFFLGMVLITNPVQWYECSSIVLQALCLSDLVS